MKPFIRAGTELRDEDGELLATLKRDVFTGDMVAKDQFDFALGHEPNGVALDPRLFRAIERAGGRV